MQNLKAIEARMMTEYGPLAEINFGEVPVHYNPDLPYGNKGIDLETGILLKNFVECYKPKTVVELGTFRGYSTAWLILGGLLYREPAHVHAFEVYPENYYCKIMAYDHFGLPKDHFTYHEIPGGIWKHEKEIPPKIDLLYHDTAHKLDPTIREMEVLLPRLPVGGIVLVDDMLHPDYGPMQGYLNKLFIEPEWKYRVVRIGHGLGVAKRIK